jgi:membrane protein implicated in regulation of membrane protease activity
MRATATTLLLWVTTISVAALVVVGTVASLVTLGVNTWHQLLTVAAAEVVLAIAAELVRLL